MSLGRSIVRGMIRRLRHYADRAPRLDALVEEHATLNGCDLLGPVQLGFRSYANDSLLRNVVVGRFCSIGRRCSIGAALHDRIASLLIRSPPTNPLYAIRRRLSATMFGSATMSLLWRE
jgi:hypothetical protein